MLSSNSRISWAQNPVSHSLTPSLFPRVSVRNNVRIFWLAGRIDPEVVLEYGKRIAPRSVLEIFRPCPSLPAPRLVLARPIESNILKSILPFNPVCLSQGPDM